MGFTFEPYDGAKDYTTIGYIMGAGTNADPVTSQNSGINFIDFRTKSTAATGDIRGMYLRHYLSGGAGGDAARIFATVDAATGTVQGAHISLSYGAEGATSIGTAAAVQAEVFCDGTSSVATGTLSLFRAVVDGGDETARNTVDYFLTGVQLGSNIFAAESSAAVSHTLKTNINGTDYYIMLSDAA